VGVCGGSCKKNGRIIRRKARIILPEFLALIVYEAKIKINSNN